MCLYVCITVGENFAESAVDTTIHSRHFLWLFLQKEKKKKKKQNFIHAERFSFRLAKKSPMINMVLIR